jgi:hypothetical protein
VTGFDVHHATLVDLPTLRRMGEQSTVLESEILYTRSADLFRSGLISSVLLPSRSVYTLVGRSGRQTVAGQVRMKLADHLAQIVYVAPPLTEDDDDSAWLALFDAMVQEVGRRGATMLTAEVDEGSPLFMTMRQSNFAVYARQEIWRRVGTPPRVPRLTRLSGDLAAETDDDTMDIQLLYSNIVPRLVQPIAVPSSESEGVVYRRNGRVQAYIAVTKGRGGIYLMPFMHPDVLGREAASIIEGVMERMGRTERTPVYVCVRRYQDWLADSLRDLAFESVSQQAVMVRHIAAGIRQPSFALPKGALEGIPTSVASPFRQSTLDPDHGERSSTHGTTNYG